MAEKIGRRETNQSLLVSSSSTTNHLGDVPAFQKKGVKKKCMARQCSSFGIVCALISALLFSVSALIVKLMQDVHPVLLSLSRIAVQFVLLFPFLFYKRNDVDILGPRGLHRFLWLRGLAGSTGMIFVYLAVDALSVGNAITITYLSMIMVPFFARIFLKESLTILDMIFALIALTGVVLITQPTFLFPMKEGEHPRPRGFGVTCAILGAMLQATSIVTIRKLGRETYAPLSLSYYSFVGIITTTLILTIVDEFQWVCYRNLPYVFSLGVLGIVGQLFLTLALQKERAGTVGILRSFQIIFVYILQVTVLGEIPSKWSLIGATLIFSCSIGIGVRKVVNEKRRKSVVMK